MVIEAAVISAVVAAVQPYLVKLGEGLGDKAVEAGVEAGPKIFSWLKQKLGGKESEAAKGAVEALEKLEAVPDSPSTAKKLETALGRALAEEPGLYEELKAMLPEGAAEGGGQVANVSGDDAKVAQVRGDGNLTSIG